MAVSASRRRMSSARAGRVLEEAVQQELHAEIVDGAAEEHGRGLVGQHGGIVPVVAGVLEHFQLFDGSVEGGIVESAAQDFVVQSADLHGGAVLAADGSFEQVHEARLAVKHALELEAVADGPVDRERANAEDALQLIEQGERVLHRAVALVDEGKDRHAAAAADLKELAGLRFDAFGGIDDHHDRVYGGEDTIGILGEILVAGGVKQVEAVAGVIKLQDGGADRDAALLLQLHPVGGRGALVLAGGHRAGELHRPAVQQELFRERGLARVRMRDNGERAPWLNRVCRIHKGGKHTTELRPDKPVAGELQK